MALEVVEGGWAMAEAEAVVAAVVAAVAAAGKAAMGVTAIVETI